MKVEGFVRVRIADYSASHRLRSRRSRVCRCVACRKQAK
jgi:hypothetical protein